MKKETVGILFVLLAGSLWGTMGAFVNYFNKLDLGSVETAWLRLVMAAILVSIYILVKNPSLFKIKLRDIWCFIGSGIFSLMIFTVCYFKTITLSSMSVAAVLLYTSPVFVMIMSLLFFKEKLTLIKVSSCFICILGSIFVAGLIGQGGAIPPLALALGIASGAAYALYSIFSRFALEKGYSSITITIYTFVLAFLGLTPITNIGGVVSVVKEVPISALVMVLSGLVTAVLPYLFYTMGLERIESGKAAVIAAIEPVVATMIGLLFFGDNLSLIQYLGIILVLFSIVLQSLKKKEK